MFILVLLFFFVGIVVGIVIMLCNLMFVGEVLIVFDSLFVQIVYIIEEGGWIVFCNMLLIFVVGLLIGLVKQVQGWVCLVVLVSFFIWNYFINVMGMIWGYFFGVDFFVEFMVGSGLMMIVGIKIFDISIIGVIVIFGLVMVLYNCYFDKFLLVFFGIFQGLLFVVIVVFFVMIFCVWLILFGWLKVQLGIELLQVFLCLVGVFGVWVYIFFECILIFIGLYYFVYGLFIFGLVVVEGGLQVYWVEYLQVFSQSMELLKMLFLEGGFVLYGNLKVFGLVGIVLVFYFIVVLENCVKVVGLFIFVILIVMLVGIIELLEFIFLFILLLLFVVYVVLVVIMVMVMYICGVVGNFGGGLFD